MSLRLTAGLSAAALALLAVGCSAATNGPQDAGATSSAGSKLEAGGLALNHTVPFVTGTRATTEYIRARPSAGPVRVSPARAHSPETQSSASATHRRSCHGGIPSTGSGALMSVNSTKPIILNGFLLRPIPHC